MPSAAFKPEWAAHLSGQLETLSELAENLTYRVLELEERLAQQELQLSALQLASGVDVRCGRSDRGADARDKSSPGPD